jgi:hypothetical protein
VVQAQAGYALRQSFSDVGVGLVAHYVDLRHPALWTTLPDWINHGLREHARCAQLWKTRGFMFGLPMDKLQHALRLEHEDRMLKTTCSERVVISIPGSDGGSRHEVCSSPHPSRSEGGIEMIGVAPARLAAECRSVSPAAPA